MRREARMIEKIISGGQTGVDRAALDVALEQGIACGGWCPAARQADDGPIPAKYPLRETADFDHTVRTEFNTRDSDGTLVLNRGSLHGGTAYAVEMARHLGKPVLVVDVEAPLPMEEILGWLKAHRIRTLHVGGPRESSRPGIYEQAALLIRDILLAARQ